MKMAPFAFSGSFISSPEDDTTTSQLAALNSAAFLAVKRILSLPLLTAFGATLTFTGIFFLFIEADLDWPAMSDTAFTFLPKRGFTKLIGRGVLFSKKATPPDCVPGEQPHGSSSPLSAPV